MLNKIILGSANFNQKYGIKKNLIKEKEIKKLFKLAKNNGIKAIDTSPLYNQSEKIIGRLNNKRFKIISKIPRPPENIKKHDIQKWLKSSVEGSLKNLRIKKFECLLIHNANSLLSRNGEEIYKGIKKMKKANITSKIGVSIYDFKLLNKILKKFRFDLIQAPLNVIDQRLVSTGWLKRLKKRNVEIHARSVFLQGILLLKHYQLPKKLKKLNKNWKIWEDWLKKNKLQSIQVCLSYIFQQKLLDGIILGFDSKKQLSEILKFKKIKENFLLPKLNLKNKELIDPRKWTN